MVFIVATLLKSFKCVIVANWLVLALACTNGPQEESSCVKLKTLNGSQLPIVYPFKYTKVTKLILI